MTQEELNKKAEEAAREVYTYTFQGMDDLIGLFLTGYEQAQKDLGWISVRERMPEPGVTVWTCVDFHGTPASLEARFYIDGKWYGRDASTAHVDYWMPVQPLKKKED